jgi:hypothetical protein
MQTFLIVAGIVIFLVVTFRILGIGVREQVVTDPAANPIGKMTATIIQATRENDAANIIQAALPTDYIVRVVSDDGKLASDTILDQPLSMVIISSGHIPAASGSVFVDLDVRVTFTSPHAIGTSVTVVVSPDTTTLDQEVANALRELVQINPKEVVVDTSGMTPEQQLLVAFLGERFPGWRLRVDRQDAGFLSLLATRDGATTRIALTNTDDNAHLHVNWEVTRHAINLDGGVSLTETAVVALEGALDY